MFVKPTRESGLVGDWCDELRRLATILGFTEQEDGVACRAVLVTLTRKTFCSAALQLYEKERVCHWGGWSSDVMINAVYSKPTTVKIVGDVLAFRIEHYAVLVEDRLRALYESTRAEVPNAVQQAWSRARRRESQRSRAKKASSARFGGGPTVSAARATATSRALGRR